MNFQSYCTIQNPEITKFHYSLSLSFTDSQAPLVSDTNTEHGDAAITGRPKRVDSDAPARQTAPTGSTTSRESIPALKTAAGAPEGAPHWPWRRGHDGARHNPDHGAVEAKVERASRLGAHHDHAGVFVADGDGLERPGHGEVDGGRALAGLREERVVPDDSGQHKWREQAKEERKAKAIALA